MKTVNDIMFFINKLIFVEYLEEVDYKKFICVRGVIVGEFRNLDGKK